MINKKLLYTIFNKDKYHIDLHAFKKANLNIIIVNNDEYEYISYTSYSKRKNCLVFQYTPAKRVVSKNIFSTCIIFNIIFIKSIIRNKQLNCILNIE